ncbi:MAG: 2-oxoacid:acceptor oxidoreductase family protein [Anaerolineales bacterium]|nr:2-oxoacid:acceptor oxidoreductase family protein [Anaerolineales bacterium]
MSATYSTYMNPDKLPLPFCPGCGHALILKALDRALVRLALPPEEVIIVTDIGCTGLSDKYFITHAFHGLHGRSITYATGLKLAQPDKKVIVLIGDGGCGIGGHHLINAARRNLDLTVLVFNNFNYGMTGGEHSVSTPQGALTVTTMHGQVEHPMDICGTVSVNGGTFVARSSSFDAALDETMLKAIQHRGFSLVDIWELCTSYFAVNNAFGKKAISDTLSALSFQTGILVEKDRPCYQQAMQAAMEMHPPKTKRGGTLLETKYASKLDRRFSTVIAGAAGAKIISAASAFSRGAVLSGLYASQRSDYPVTVKTGHSLAEIVISAEKLLYTSVKKPDALIILFPEGLEKTRKLLPLLTEEQTVYLNANLGPVDTAAEVRLLHFENANGWGRKPNFHAIMVLSEVLRAENLYPIAAFEEALSLHPRFAKENLAAVHASEGILDQKR